jgi:protein-tyrosine-phosphatase
VFPKGFPGSIPGAGVAKFLNRPLLCFFMRLLFICKGNVARSQMAAELFTKYTGIKAFSAGVKVFENENQKIREVPLAEPIIRLIKKEGINIEENSRKQLTPEMLNLFDRIIVMSELENNPNYLQQHPKAEFWEIKDPKGMSDADVEEIIFQLKKNIEEFIRKNKIGRI